MCYCNPVIKKYIGYLDVSKYESDEEIPDGSIIDKVTTYDDYLANNADARKRTIYEAAREEDSN